jgi:putative pyruvate formate lyase activating enzyme
MRHPPQACGPLALPAVSRDPDAVAAALAWADARYRACDVCGLRCGVDRHAGQTGRCGLGTDARIYKEYLHLGEERLLVPSHAIYLSGCSFRCAFCSDDTAVRHPREVGVVMPPEVLAHRIAERRREGARNVNFVGGVPDVNVRFILQTLALTPPDTHVVWNTNLWTTPEAVAHLRPVVGTWLIDWKFGSDACALKLAGVRGYLAGLGAALAWVRDPDGPAPPLLAARSRAGLAPFVLVRHLLMPGHLGCCTEPTLRHLAAHHPEVPVNLMTGYHPYRLGPAKDSPMAGRPGAEEKSAARRLLATLPFHHPLVDGVPA